MDLSPYEKAYLHDVRVHADPLYLERDLAFVSAASRKAAKKQGATLPDGSFPIRNEKELRAAIKLAGHAKDPGKARAHIKARARALGLSKLIPDTW